MHEDRGLYAYTCRLVAVGGGGPEIVEMVGEIETVLHRAQSAGVLVDGLLVRDLVPLLAFTATVPSERQQFFLGLLLRGLRAPG